MPPYGLLAPPTYRLSVTPPPLLGSTTLPQGSLPMGILEALWVLDACSLSEFDENFLIFFHFEWENFFSQNWLKSHFRPHVFLFFFIHIWGLVGGSDPNVIFKPFP